MLKYIKYNILKNILVVFLVVLFVRAGKSCSCPSDFSIELATGIYPVVVQGIVIDLKERNFKSKVKEQNVPGFYFEVSLQIIETYKGKSKASIIQILTPRSSCGVKFESGKNYIVYGNSNVYASEVLVGEGGKSLENLSNTIWTDVCSRTSEATTSEIEGIRSAIKTRVTQNDFLALLEPLLYSPVLDLTADTILVQMEQFSSLFEIDPAYLGIFQIGKFTVKSKPLLIEKLRLSEIPYSPGIAFSPVLNKRGKKLHFKYIDKFGMKKFGEVKRDEHSGKINILFRKNDRFRFK